MSDKNDYSVFKFSYINQRIYSILVFSVHVLILKEF